MGKDKLSIQTKFFNKMIYLVFISIGLWCFVWIYDETSTFKSEAESLRLEYVESQKNMIKNQVTNVVNDINNLREEAEQELKRTIIDQVNQAHQITSNIYQQNYGSKKLPEIKKMIKDALRPVRFSDGRGYYFAVSMDGIEQLYPVRPEFEGKNLIGLQDSKGSFVIQEEIKTIKQSGEGFVKSFWTKPDEDPIVRFPKITFVKLFKPLDWYIGTGDYLDDFVKKLQKKALISIAKLRFETEGYFFGSTYQGDSLFSNGKITIGSGNIWNLTDPAGVKIIQEQKKAAENPKGGFVYYSWNKLNTSKLSPKVSYVRGIHDWEWTIGAGVYLDTIEQTILVKKAALMSGLKKRIIRTIWILAGLLCLIYFWSKRISNQIENSVETFLSFLNKAATESVTINPDNIQLMEFREIAISTNKMLKDRMQSENKLLESEERFRRLAENAKDMIYRMSLPEGLYEYVSPASINVFGYTPEEFIKTPLLIQNAIHPDWRDYFNEQWKALLDGNMPPTYEYQIVHGKTKGTRWLHQRNVLISNDEGQSVAIEGIVTDITERKKAEEEKIKAQKIAGEQKKLALVGQVAGKMAHDFNNILGIILGNTELTLLDCQEPETRKTLELIFEQTIRGKNLTKNLVAFAKDQEPKQEFFMINEKMDLVVNLLKKDLEGIEVIKEEKAGIPELLADPGMIEHALVNLLQNSIHALSMVEHPRITVKTYSRDDSICFEIEDNGCGIPKEHLESIYEPSFTLKGNKDVTDSYKSNVKGTGYGMANVKKYVEQHKGNISVESEVGVGATFTICLPIIKKELTTKEKAELKKEITQFEKCILLIEDETAISDVQYRILTSEPCNHKVDVAHNGQMAKDLFERNIYDFVSLDYVLPGGINGMDVYHHIRKTNQTVPVLFISGNIEFLESIKELKQKDAYIDHLSKPCQNKDYVNGINKLLEKTLAEQ